jgi:BREX protein BrxB
VTEIERLVHNYERFARLPWDRTLAGPQRVWFAIYDPAQERRLRLRIQEFEVATKNAGRKWAFIDLTDTFAHWIANDEYREAYFEQPEDMDLALEDYAQHVIDLVTQALTGEEVDEDTIVAVGGLGSLFGLMRASVLFDKVAPYIRGRLLAFFPGHKEGSNYRLLDARDGWNYLAVPITANDGE